MTNVNGYIAEYNNLVEAGGMASSAEESDRIEAKMGALKRNIDDSGIYYYINDYGYIRTN